MMENNFFQKISFLKNEIFQNASLDEIAKTLIIYFKNKDLVNNFFNEQNKISFNDEIKTNESNETLKQIDEVEILVQWKYLRKLFSKDELNEDETKEYKIYLYLNNDVNEIILSKNKLEGLINDCWSSSFRLIKKKESIVLILDTINLYSELNYKIIYEKELNVLHIITEVKE